MGVTLSTARFEEQFEIGVNDVEKVSFRVWGPEDIQASTRYRPLLHFETAAAAAEFRKAEPSGDFDYESSDGMWKLFTHDGRDTGKNTQHVVEALVPTRFEKVSGGLTEEFRFSEEVYLRASRTGKNV